MSASGRLTRLLALVPWLLAHDGVTLTAAADHFGVTEDQLEQDLWLLVVCGVPGYGPDQLIDIQFWDDGRVHVLDPLTLARPLRLSSEEATTLLVALRMLAQLPGVEDREAVLSAAAKLEQGTHATDRFVAIDVDVPQQIRDSIDAALAQRRDLDIEYASATSDEVTRRTIRPMRLLSVDGLSYLEAYCLSAEALRTFRLDRILASAVSGERPADWQLAEAEDSPLPARPRRTATLLLEPSARWIIDVHHAVADRAPEPDGRTRVQLPMHSPDWVVRLVLSLRGAATVVDPPELGIAVADAARAALSAYPDRLQ
jgi:proteasome accessory factor C